MRGFLFARDIVNTNKLEKTQWKDLGKQLKVDSEQF